MLADSIMTDQMLALPRERCIHSKSCKVPCIGPGNEMLLGTNSHELKFLIKPDRYRVCGSSQCLLLHRLAARSFPVIYKKQDRIETQKEGMKLTSTSNQMLPQSHVQKPKTYAPLPQPTYTPLNLPKNAKDS
jgi:hypothetical protein